MAFIVFDPLSPQSMFLYYAVNAIKTNMHVDHL